MPVYTLHCSHLGESHLMKSSKMLSVAMQYIIMSYKVMYVYVKLISFTWSSILFKINIDIAVFTKHFSGGILSLF